MRSSIAKRRLGDMSGVRHGLISCGEYRDLLRRQSFSHVVTLAQLLDLVAVAWDSLKQKLDQTEEALYITIKLVLG